MCSEQTHSYRFGNTWGRVNNDRIFIFGWTVPLRSINCICSIMLITTKIIYMVPPFLKKKKLEWRSVLITVIRLAHHKAELIRIGCQWFYHSSAKKKIVLKVITQIHTYDYNIIHLWLSLRCCWLLLSQNDYFNFMVWIVTVRPSKWMGPICKC